MKRQNIRKLVGLVSLLLFPITMYYLSPYLIIMGAMEGIVSGSFIVFGLLLVSGIVLGRGFCAYICPMGALQECAFGVNNKAPKQGWKNKIKYVIWTIWFLFIIFNLIKVGGAKEVDFLYQTEHGISISSIYGYIIYYLVIFLVVIPAFFCGKRIFCHYFCWMAPFMVIGTKIGRLLHLPGLHIKADEAKCISCKICNKNCPMSLNIEQMVKDGEIHSMECIGCGMCIDTCPKKVLKYSMKNN